MQHEIPRKYSRRLRALILATAVGAVTLPAVRPAWATTDTWIGGSFENWTTGGDWSLGAMPATTQDAVINNAPGNLQIHFINYNYFGPTISLASLSLDVAAPGKGTNELIIPAATNTLTVNGSEYIGKDGSAVLSQADGTNNLTGSTALYIGFNTNAFGTYALGGGLLSLAAPEYLGYTGKASFNQSGGTHSLSGATGVMNLGYLFNATGTYTLSAGLLTGAAAESVGSAGTGIFNQSGGTNALSGAGGLILGNSNGASGSYTLSGTGLITATGNAVEIVGYGGNATFTQSGGTNSLTGGGTYLDLALYPGSTATYNLSGGLLSETGGNSENIGENGLGIFNQSGGTHTFTTGMTINHSSTYTLSNGVLNSGGGIALGNFEFNAPNGGEFIQSGGIHNNNYLYLEVTSSYTLSGGTLTSAQEIVGLSGTSNFNQTGGTNTVTGATNFLSIGYQTGGTGAYDISGGSLNVAGTTFVGYRASTESVAGTLSVHAPATFATTGLTIGDHGLVQLGIGGAGLDTISTLTIVPGGLMDLNTSSLTMNYGTTGSPNGSIRNYISSAYNVSGGPWSGSQGITSSIAHGNPAHHSLAFADGADGIVRNLPPNISTAILAGGTLPAGVELITYAYTGDANLDGKVDFADFILLSNHFGTPDINWDHGNFNYDPNVDFGDFIILSNNFGAGVTGGSGTGATPLQLAQFNALAQSFGISQSQIAAWDASIANLPDPGIPSLILTGALTLLIRRRRPKMPSPG